MLSDLRRTCYGEVEQLTSTLEEASTKLSRHVELTCVQGARVEHRVKSLLSTFIKVTTKGGKAPRVASGGKTSGGAAAGGKAPAVLPRDVLAMRLVLPDGDERTCYDAMRAVHRLWRPCPDSYKDYIAEPKDNGYRSLHDTVLLPSGMLMEVQIRSASMHADAERGAASHRLYKQSSMSKLFGAAGDFALIT